MHDYQRRQRCFPPWALVFMLDVLSLTITMICYVLCQLDAKDGQQKGGMEPKVLAKVIFDQHRKEASDGEESDEDEHDEEKDVEELIENVEQMKHDMSEMTV